MTDYHFETLAIRTQTERSQHKEHSTPLFLSSSFVFDSAEEGAGLFSGELEGNLYSRFSNPNTDEFVRKLCALERCESGIATASGMAAVYLSFVPFLQQGDHVVVSSAIFGNTRHIVSEILPKMGVEFTYVSVEDNQQWEEAIRPNTRILYVETPSNPTLKTADLSFLGKLCANHEILFVVDNCFATPYLQNPVDFGADLVVHSATKYLDGQGRVLGGAIVGKKEPVSLAYDFLRRTGASLSPFNAWVLSKSLETLALRMERHCGNAQSLSCYLQQHEDVEQVIYPGSKTYAQYVLSASQMRMGGALVGMEIKGGINR
ncbi:MAG: aminotransferase class I/II-fold pyridoxal phosphate-dependent enzyme, partial [Luteibaculum sp.]